MNTLNYNHRLEKAFEHAPVLPLTENARYVLFSDCHRGDGSWGDNFLKNQHLYAAALQYYFDKDYTYVELGDGDELWENRSMKQIIEVHSDIFRLLSKFYQKQRLYMLYGNHDIVKKDYHKKGDLQHFLPKKDTSCFDTCFCMDKQEHIPLFPDIRFYSGLILKDQLSDVDIYLTHGHQVDLLNSTLWPLARFLVRYLWRPIEQVGIQNPTSPAKNNKRRQRTEQRLCQWAKEHQRILITGHTHHVLTGSKDSSGSENSSGSKASHCFNTGSCVYPNYITCIEIVHRQIMLVKWAVRTQADGTLYVGRELLGKHANCNGY